MEHIIDRSGHRRDDWRLLRGGEEEGGAGVAEEDHVIVPLALWLSSAPELIRRQGRTAVWLAPDDEPSVLLPTIELLTLIAVDFPSFTDGRGYSTARLLRERYKYAGELRAVGDVWSDHLQALWLVGFDSFEIKAGKALPASGHAADTISEHYQSSVRVPLPSFRRNVALG